MRKFLIAAALVSTAATAMPALAQPGYGHGQGRVWNNGGPSRQQINELLRDLNQAENRIDRARGISRREAIGLRREAGNIRGQLNRAMRNGINNREFFALRAQVNRLEQRLRLERNDRDGRRF
jgi:Spy/CpxP family protein refolding chaperone